MKHFRYWEACISRLYCRPGRAAKFSFGTVAECTRPSLHAICNNNPRSVRWLSLFLPHLPSLFCPALCLTLPLPAARSRSFTFHKGTVRSVGRSCVYALNAMPNPRCTNFPPSFYSPPTTCNYVTLHPLPPKAIPIVPSVPVCVGGCTCMYVLFARFPKTATWFIRGEYGGCALVNPLSGTDQREQLWQCDIRHLR